MTPIGSSRELKRRVVSALVLALCALAGLAAGDVVFAGLVAVLAVVMSWEWGKMVRRGGGMDASFFAHAATVAAASIAAVFAGLALGMAIVSVGAAVLWWLNFSSAPGISVLGVLYVGIPAVALAWLRSLEPGGLVAVMVLFTVVWSTDSAAFIGGRLIGGPRLYKSISPQKTWAGFISAVIAAGVVGLCASMILAAPSTFHLVAIAVVLGVAAQLGDLAESALKRIFGLKDTSDLIPGHGGFLDRLDGLVAAATVALILGLLINSDAPATGLVFGS